MKAGRAVTRSDLSPIVTRPAPARLLAPGVLGSVVIEHIALTTALLDRINGKNGAVEDVAGRVATFVMRLPDQIASFGLRRVIEKCPAVACKPEVHAFFNKIDL